MYARMILLGIFLLMLTIPTTVICAHEAKDSVMRSTPAEAVRAFRPVIEFGHRGGNLRPYRIGIDAAGQVKVLEGGPQLKADRIPAEKVRELLQTASDKSFWETSSADDAEAQRVLPDFGSVFVKVRVTGRRLIYHQGQHVGPLGRFYTQLSDLVLA